MKKRLSAKLHFITLSAGIAIITTITSPPISANEESTGARIISGTVTEAINTQEQQQNIESKPSTVTLEEATKYYDSLKSHPELTEKDQNNLELYSYAIGYMSTYPKPSGKQEEMGQAYSLLCYYLRYTCKEESKIKTYFNFFSTGACNACSDRFNKRDWLSSYSKKLYDRGL